MWPSSFKSLNPKKPLRAYHFLPVRPLLFVLGLISFRGSQEHNCLRCFTFSHTRNILKIGVSYFSVPIL